MSLLTAVRRLPRRLSTLARFLDHLEQPMATDRDLMATILASLGPIAEAVAAKDARIAQLEQQLADAGVAAAADEAEDAAALQPVADAVQALRDALAPRVDGTPDPIPVEEVPTAVETPTAEGPDTGTPADATGPDTAEQPPA